MRSIVGLLLALLTLSSVGFAQGGPWTQQTTGLPAGYDVLALHAVGDNIVWGIGMTASGPSRYFIRTTDGGTTWACNTITTAPTNFSTAGIYAFDDKRAWVVMWNYYPSEGGESGGLFGTTDGGASWKKDSIVFSTHGGFPDLIHFFDVNNGVAVGDPIYGYSEIYTTSNGGANWSRVPNASIPPALSSEYAIVSNFTATANCLWFPVYTSAGGTGRYIRTTDKGSTWSVHVFPNTAPGWGAPVLEFQDDSIGLGQASLAGVMKTTDGGLTWNLLPNTSWLLFNHLECVPHAPGMYVAASAYRGQSPSSSYVWGTVATIDGGITWSRIGQLAGAYTPLSFGSRLAGWRSQAGNPNLYKLTISPGRFIGACPDFVPFPVTEVGATAETVEVDIANYGTDPLSLTSILPPGPNFKIVKQPTLPLALVTLQSAHLAITFAPQTGGTLRDSVVVISDASNTLRTSVSLTGTGFAAQPAKAGVLYAASGSLYSLNTTNGTPTRIDTLGGIPIHGLTIRPSTKELYGASAMATATTLYRIGSSSALAMPVCTFPIGNMRAIAFGHGGALYGATTGGSLYQLNAATGEVIFIGNTGGVSFMGLTFSPGGTLWASGYEGGDYDKIFTIDTSTGEATLIGRTGDNVYTPSIAFGPNGVLYGLRGAGADTNSIVSISTLTGAGTRLFSTGMQWLMAIAILDPAVSVKDQPSAGVPKVFALDQNYPNPFNPSTTIKFELPKAAHVTLSVFDILGREVSVLANERRIAGIHEVKFDGSSLASGVYFYRLSVSPPERRDLVTQERDGQAGDFVSTKKLVLLK